jgi:hypothetical protein
LQKIREDEFIKRQSNVQRKKKNRTERKTLSIDLSNKFSSSQKRERQPSKQSSYNNSKTISILPNAKEKQFEDLEKILNETGLVDPNVTKQFIKLRKLGKGGAIIGSHPELELAISNVPAQYQRIALDSDKKEKKNTEKWEFWMDDKGTNAKWKNCRSKSSQSISVNFLKESHHKQIKSFGFQNDVLNGWIKKKRRISQVKDYSDSELKTITHEKKRSYKLSLNDDLKADLDSSGSQKWHKKYKLLLSDASMIPKNSHIKSHKTISLPKKPTKTPK